MKTCRSRALLTAVGLTSLLTCLTASSLAADIANVFDLVDNLPFAGLPTGPYRAWSTDERQQAHKLIVLGCARTAIAFMQHIYQEAAPKDRMAEESKTFSLACMAMHLPEDHPEKAKLQSEAMRHYQAAKALGSELPCRAVTGGLGKYCETLAGEERRKTRSTDRLRKASQKSKGTKFGVQLRSKARQRRFNAMGRAALSKAAMERAEAGVAIDVMIT